MLIKLDVEKAFDTVEQNSILTTLQRTNFPDIWIKWIESCLTSFSFSILLNGQPSHWFKSTRGLRQGDPLSPLLFLLVLCNRSTILNRALSISFIPSFNHTLTPNFSHLMFADDLILITKATRLAARNTIFCLNMYADLTGQKINFAKSALYLPPQLNKKLSKSISSILHIKKAAFPLTTLETLSLPLNFLLNTLNFF